MIYFNPPRGTSLFKELELSSVTRLKFLLKLHACTKSTNIADTDTHSSTASFDSFTDAAFVPYSDCLIEGSRKDAITHFIMCIAFCTGRHMSDFIQNAELRLFRTRLVNQNHTELLALFETIRRYSRKICANETNAHAMEICGKNTKETKLGDSGGNSSHRYEHCRADSRHRMSSQDMLEICRVFYENTSSRSSVRKWIDAYLDTDLEHCITVPFTCVILLVAKRRVTVKGGNVILRASQTGHLLCALFRRAMSDAIEAARNNLTVIVSDPRAMRIVSRLQAIYRRSVQSHTQATLRVAHTDVHRLSVAFPPCMAAIYRTLLSQRRLPHHDRIKFTLFLKDVGLNVDDNVSFWTHHYSIDTAATATHKCNWNSDSRRYVYSVRHLYGLEGGRTNYSGHCCHSIQSCSNTGDVGVCPFTLDQHTVPQFLRAEALPTRYHDNILNAVLREDYSIACAKFLEAKRRYQRTVKRKAETYHPGCENNGTGNDWSSIVGDTTTVDCSKSEFSHRSRELEIDGFVANTKISDLDKKNAVCNDDVHFKQESDGLNAPGEIPTETDQSNHDTHRSDIDGCFEHDVCPSQLSQLPLDAVYKPIDFYMSYAKLLDGLCTVAS